MFDLGMDALTLLLSPLTPEDFVRDYFDQRPIYIPGHAGKFEDLFRPEDLRASIGPGVAITANLGGARYLSHVDPRDIDCLMASGATLCAADLTRTNPKLASFAAEIGARLGFAGKVDVRAYWSPDGVGFDMHFDARVATTLQISGKKRWRFSRAPAVRHPVDNVIGEGGRFHYVREDPTPRSWERFAPPDECTFEEVVLEPGDVLCLPAGTWHEAKAIGQSLALNLAFNAVGFGELLKDAISSRLLALAEWRRSPPVRASRAISNERDPGAPPPEVARFFSERLVELRALLAELDPQGPELAHAWRRRLYSRSGSAPARPNPAPALELAPSDWLHRYEGPIDLGYSVDMAGERTAALYRVGYFLPLPAELFSTVQKILERAEPFRAGDACDLPWDVAHLLLCRLLEAGFLARTESESTP